ncbi:glycosyltransferase family 4 protein [Photobacterium phosphoreum]|uniref:glycosyltransferase family 4 protein n=1 Tax=Photobacterium phosphoreum TaxID=659 RepID=UPI002432097A|nr:glycosyltransferase family 4 protein [Photobacterium phosphoreum]
MKKNVKILSRPDHSTYLYEGLRKEKELDVEIFTFDVIKEGTIFSKLFPNKRHVDKDVKVSYSVTFVRRFLILLRYFVRFNWLKIEVYFSNFFFNLCLRNNLDGSVIHYWPVYASKAVFRYKSNKNIITVAEIYEANPNFVNPIFMEENDKRNKKFKPYNLMVDQNSFFEFEKNVIVPSSYVMATYKDSFPNVNFYVVPLGLDINIPNLHIVKDNIIVKFAFVGRASVEKGIYTLFDAAKLMFHRVGRCFEVHAFGPINELNLKDELSENINFLGNHDKKTLYDKLKDYDVVVLPSFSDAYSLAIVEAQLLGLPVIVSDSVGICDVICNHKSGLIFKTGDHKDLADKMIQLLDFDNRSELHVNAIRNRDFHTIESYSKRILKVYKKLNE